MFSSGRMCFVATNITLNMNDHHIVLHKMGCLMLIMLGCSCFASPDYLILNAWIRATVLFPSFSDLTSTDIHIFVKIIPGCNVIYIE